MLENDVYSGRGGELWPLMQSPDCRALSITYLTSFSQQHQRLKQNSCFTDEETGTQTCYSELGRRCSWCMREPALLRTQMCPKAHVCDLMQLCLPALHDAAGKGSSITYHTAQNLYEQNLTLRILFLIYVLKEIKSDMIMPSKNIQLIYMCMCTQAIKQYDLE